jgi:hypothetical protein
MKNTLIFLVIFLISIGSCFSQYRAKEIKAIDIYCQKVENKKWLKIKDYGSIEGDSDTKLYYSKNGLQKIIHIIFGENIKTIITYYLINKKIVKVKETEHDYHGNYADPNLNKKETTVETTKSYFQKGKMFHQIGEDCGSSFTKEFLDSETLRLQNRYKEILSLVK